jgi:hypothetical protein
MAPRRKFNEDRTQRRVDRHCVMRRGAGHGEGHSAVQSVARIAIQKRLEKAGIGGLIGRRGEHHGVTCCDAVVERRDLIVRPCEQILRVIAQVDDP